MAKNWIKKAIKHPGRCTPGSPNYDCPKGSPQWNLAQRFKHGDLHKKEDGGYAASDNIDIEGYTNPLAHFAEDGKNIRYELPIQYVPSESTSTKMNSGQKNKQKVSGQSKGLKEDSIAENIFEIFDPSGISSWDDVHREWNNGKFNSEDIIQPLTAIPILGKIGKLPQGMKLGKDIYKSGSLLKLLKGLNIEEGVSDVYEDNIKKMGGMISDDDCLECGGKVYANNGLNIDSTLNANKNLNWVDRLYQKNTPTIFLPGESHPSTHYMENADNFVYPTIIQNEDGKLEYLGNKAYDYAMKTNTAIKFKTPEEAEYFAKNYKKGKGVLKKFNMGGKIKAEDGLNSKSLIPPKPEQIDFEMERQLPPDASYERDVRKFSWNNRDTDPEQIKLDSSYMLYKKPKGYSNVYNKGKLIGYTIDNKILIPGEPNFQNGGIVKAWIQKFSNGGYIADGGFPAGQELTQPTTNYYNWGNYGNQNSFLTPDQINQKPFENPYQNMNLQQPNVPQFNIPKGQEIEPLTSIGAQKMTPDLQGIRNRVNQSMQDIAPKSKSPMNMNAVNMGLDIGTQSMPAAANLMGSLGKDNSKAQAFGQGASGAMNVASQVTAPFKDIPIAGKAIEAVGKTLGFFIGGALEARRQGIENEEMDKYNKLQEYTSRNTQTAQQPSYYGQYMSKYGSNIKNLEQRLIDDIFSEYDKFMKLT